MSWLPKKSVVVPIDFTDPCMRAVDEGLKLVDDPSHLHVVHVLPRLSAMEPGVVWDTVDNESRRQHATDAVRKKLGDARYGGVDVRIGFGGAAHEIAKLAKELGAELIVMPQRTQSRGMPPLLGSVAQRVIGIAHCPVLVIRDCD